MPEHPERSVSPGLEVDPLGPEAPAARPAPEPVVILAPGPSGGNSARFLPPLLILFLGTAFLAYRAAAPDWRGLTAWLDRSGSTTPPADKALALNTRPTPAPTPTPDSAAPALDTPAATPAPSPAPDAAAPDPLADAQRDAEATRKRIEELERFKAEEAKKLAETEDQRRADAARDRFGRRFGFGPGAGPGGVNPADIERQLAAQHELLRRQMEEVMRQQMAWMDQMQRRHLREFERGLNPGDPAQDDEADADAAPRGGNPPWPPRGFGFAAPMPVPMPWGGRPQAPRMPRFGQRGPVAPPAPGRDEEGEFRTPDGGVGRFRRFQSDDGTVSRFEYRWQSTPGNAMPSPPPRPGRVFD